MPDTGTVLLVAVVVATLVTRLADRLMSPVSVMVSLGCAQVLMHTVLDSASMHHAASTPTADGWCMTAAHGVAGVLSGFVLAKADKCLRWMITALRSVLPPAQRSLVGAASSELISCGEHVVDILRGIMSRTNLARRGPPCPC
jgi:hypothetical protein